MHKYFVKPEQFSGETVTLTGDDAHHAVRVMRMSPGDCVVVSDGAGQEALARITEAGGGQVTAAIVERLSTAAEPPVDVWIAQCLPKGDRLETVIQKCTEIGASRILPIVSERTIVRLEAGKLESRLARWRKIAKEAAEQSERSRVPDIDAPRSWSEMLRLAAEADHALVCYEREGELNLRMKLRELAGRAIGGESGVVGGGGDGGSSGAGTVGGASDKARDKRPTILLAIGPEGGLSPGEVAAAMDAGCDIVSLGRTILRTDTASIVGLTCILYEYGAMGGY
jgi:16S rRNA (uracil1498-N3)-methyltransferase